MKIMIEITGLTSGESATSKRNWVRLTGRDRGGRHVSAVCFDQAAENVSKTVGRMVPEGEDVASQRLLVDLTGEFKDGKQIVRDGKPVTREDGSPVLSRSFFIETFRLLTGPMLEMARMRRDADARLTRAEKLALEGDFKGAYRVLGEFAAGLCARPFELADAVSSDNDDEVFGDPVEADAKLAAAPAAATTDAAVGQDDPEAAAAEIFRREDAIADATVKVEAKVETVSVAAADVLDDASDETTRTEPSVEAPSITPTAEAADDETSDKVADASESQEASAAPAPRVRQGFGARRSSFSR
jgi:hypothetical protein